MTLRKKVEALGVVVSEKLRELHLLASDTNVPEEDRKRAKIKLQRFKALLVEQQAQASTRSGETRTRLSEATQ